MFSRIQNAIQIVTYRESETGGDAVIVERETVTPSRPGKIIAGFVELLVAVYTIGYLAGRIGDHISKSIPDSHSVSLGTLTGAVAVFLMLTLHWIREDIEKKIRARLNLVDVLAPYFGHRLDYTVRVLKGSVRAA
jgi:H+/Cl- antiporter ClcA